uniref:Uncharacterized protein n=1 Tax=Zymoseptoria tritici TaxID=1047171 RepID=A0A3G2SCT4_ZYMTR|nr:hypothetical protein [Zymoseptoria tritici]
MNLSLVLYWPGITLPGFHRTLYSLHKITTDLFYVCLFASLVITILTGIVLTEGSVKSPVELEGSKSPVELDGSKSPVELDGSKSPVELDGSKSPAELDGSECPAELEASTPLEQAPSLPKSGTQSTFNPDIDEIPSSLPKTDLEELLDLAGYLVDLF